MKTPLSSSLSIAEELEDAASAVTVNQCVETTARLHLAVDAASALLDSLPDWQEFHQYCKFHHPTFLCIFNLLDDPTCVSCSPENCPVYSVEKGAGSCTAVEGAE